MVPLYRSELSLKVVNYIMQGYCITAPLLYNMTRLGANRAARITISLMYAAEGAKRLNKQLNLHVACVLLAVCSVSSRIRERDEQSQAFFSLFISPCCSEDWTQSSVVSSAPSARCFRLSILLVNANPLIIIAALCICWWP